MKPVVIPSTRSFAAVKIAAVQRSGENVLGHAIGTGFIWETEEHYWLVTNAHVLAGWDYVRGKAMAASGGLPTEVEISLKVQHPSSNEDTQLISQYPISLPLYEEDGSPGWCVHPTLREAVDVAATTIGPSKLDLTQHLADNGLVLHTIPVNMLADTVDFQVNPGDDAFVLGFPLSIDGGKGFPIWKRASIASEPHVDLDGLPKILIDTATRQGMSGSPVLAVRRGLTTPIGADFASSFFGQSDKFLGVYSGRIGDDPLGAQLGIVWKATAIEEIVQGQVYARMPWDTDNPHGQNEV